MKRILGFLRDVAYNFPALTSGTTFILVTLLARFGVHVTANQLTAVMSLMAAVLAIWVHRNVVPVEPSRPLAKR